MLGEQGYVDLEPHARRLVHDVDHEDHRQFRLDQLQRHREHALQVARVKDVDHQVGTLVQEYLAGNPLLLGDREYGIHPRGVDHLELLAVDGRVAAGHLHRGAGVVGHRHIGAGQGVEKDTLAHIGVPHQRHLSGAAVCNGWSFVAGTFLLQK